MSTEPLPPRPVRLPLFIIDTNILYEVFGASLGLEAHSLGSADRPVLTLEQLLACGCVGVPMTVLVEFLGKFFHTRIDIENYDVWHRHRRIALNPLISRLTEYRPQADQPEIGKTIIGKTSEENWVLNRLHNCLLPAELAWLQSSTSRAKTVRPLDPKFLDGGDAMILAEAIAMAKRFPDWEPFFVTNDNALTQAVQSLHAWASTRRLTKPPSLRLLKSWRLAKMLVPTSPHRIHPPKSRLTASA